MLAKHPQADPPKLPTSAAPSPVKINEATLIRALRSFPQDTAPGPSGLRANHLKEAFFVHLQGMLRLHFICFVILSISSVLVKSHLMLFLISVLPIFTALKRSQMVLGQLQLERFFIDYLPNVYLSLYFQKHLIYYLPFSLVWGYLLVVKPLFIQLAASKVIIQFLLTASGFFKLIFQMLLTQLIVM